MDSTEGQFEFAQVCKSGWGSALLYTVTGDEEYRKWTLRMGDWFAETQAEDGSWRRFSRDKESATIHNAAEFVVHLDTIISGLASRP